MLGNIGAIWSWLEHDTETSSGEIINEKTALQITDVYSCVRLISQTVGSLPLKLYERTGKGRMEAVDNNLYSLLTVAPNPEMNAVVFWECVVAGLALTGNSYVFVQRVNGQVDALWPLNPAKTRPDRVKDTSPLGSRLVYECREGLDDGQPPRIYEAEDILHFKLFSLDGMIGLSPIRTLKEDLGLARAATTFGGRIFVNNGHPGGIMENVAGDLDPLQLAKAREDWQAAQSGKNAFKTAFLNGTQWKYTALSLSMEDLEFLKTRQFQRAQIAGAFGIPPHMIGDTTRQSNTNSEQEALTLVQFTLRPYLTKIENEIQRVLLPTVGRKANKFFVQFDVRDLLRGDFKTTMEGLALGRQWGFYNANKILEELGENPIGPIGDVYWVPVNYANAETLLLDPEPKGEEQWKPAPDAPAQLPPASTDDSADSADSGDEQPTSQERSIVQQASSITVVFRDCIGRLLNRDKRDLDTVKGIFEPALRSIVAIAVNEANHTLGTSWHDEKAEERIVTECVRGLENRATKWTGEDADNVTPQEFKRALRTIAANVYRECAATLI